MSSNNTRNPHHNRWGGKNNTWGNRNRKKKTANSQYNGGMSNMEKHIAHSADRRRRSGAQTSATEVERSRTGRRSVRAQWRTPPEGEVWV